MTKAESNTLQNIEKILQRIESKLCRNERISSFVPTAGDDKGNVCTLGGTPTKNA